MADPTETVLYSFKGPPTDGANPVAGLYADSSGNLFGTTKAGGAGPCSVSGIKGGCGTVFKLAPPAIAGGAWTETVLYAFTGGDEANPAAGLIFDSNGNLYGTSGGLSGTGVVFKLAPPATAGGTWTETVLYSFCSKPNCSDGSDPIGPLIFDSSGNLYGTTSAGGPGTGICGYIGCGTVFKLTAPATAGAAWTETVLYAFCISNFLCSDGYHPVAGLIFDSSGNLYGTTYYGGGGSCPLFTPDLSGCGVAFKLAPPATAGGAWTETVLYSFTSSAGAFPVAGLIFDSSGNLYGTTGQGGSGPCTLPYRPTVVVGCGTVFKVAPPATAGGVWTETVLYSFGISPSDGVFPSSGLIADSSGNLYGTTSQGGTGPCPPRSWAPQEDAARCSR